MDNTDRWTTFLRRSTELSAESVHKFNANLLYYLNSLDMRAISSFVWFLVLVAFVHHFFFIRPKKNGPPLVKGWVPFVNNFLYYLPWAERLMEFCRKQYGDIYTVRIGKIRLHVVLDPSSGAQIFREHRTFDFSQIVDYAEILMFGIAKNQVNNPVLRKESIVGFNQHILSQKSVDILTEKFGANLRNVLSKKLNELNTDGSLNRDGVVLDMKAFISKIAFECTGKTLFGETWPTDEDFLQDVMTYDEYVPWLVRGYPYVVRRKGILARERIFQRLVKLLEQPLVNPSEFVAHRKEVRLFRRQLWKLAAFSTRLQLGRDGKRDDFCKLINLCFFINILR